MPPLILCKNICFKFLLLLAVSSICCSTGHSSQISASDPFIDAKKLREVEGLVDLAMDDSRAESSENLEFMKKVEAENDRIRLQRLKSEPGLGPYLVALAEKFTKTKSHGFSGVFQAMSLRQDIDQQVIDLYIQKASKLIEIAPENIRSDEKDYILGISHLLSAHLTPENESLLIKMLSLDEKNKSTDYKMVAGRALAKSGTSRSLPALQEAAKWMHLHAKEQNHPQLSEQMDGYLTVLSSRINGTGSDAASQAKSTASVQSHLPHSFETLPTTNEQSTSTEWFAWAVMIGAAIGLVWLVFKMNPRANQ